MHFCLPYATYFFITGCSVFELRRVALTPSHHLLSVGEWRQSSMPRIHPSARDTSSPSVMDRQFQRNLMRLNRGEYTTNTQEFELLNRIFRGTRYERQAVTLRSRSDILKQAQRIQTKKAQPGDVIIFGPTDPTGPSLAIIHHVNRLGTMTALAIHLGRARSVKVTPAKRQVRRYNGQVVNSFVRGHTTRRPDI